MKLAWSLLLCLGCSATHHRALSPDTYSIRCNRGVGDCHARAAQLCGRYAVLGGADRTGYIVQHGQYSSTAIPVRQHEIVVRCE